MRRHLVAAAALALSTALLAGCSDDEPGTGTSQTIQITIEGDSVTPSGERVEVDRGAEITLEVEADAPGELHVHTSPEEELSYDEGTTALTLTIDEPGVVDVEAHELEVVVVQLEVS